MKGFRAPGEQEARERTWRVVRAAFEQREPVSWPRRHARPLAAAAVGAAALAALLSPPGRSFIHSLRKAVGVEHAKTELFSLPARGRLLVQASSGVWVVHPDGSKRLLPDYRQASWSPHGLYLVAAKRNGLATLDDRGNVHWTLARPQVAFPRWGGTRTDTRVAYTDREPVPAVRAVGGDGRGDHWVAKDFVPIAPAWQPGSGHVLAVAHTDGRIRLWGTDTRALVGTSPKVERPLQVAWSNDGSRLYVLARTHLYILDARARLVAVRRLRAGTAFAMAVPPRGTKVAVIMRRHGRSEVGVIDGRYSRVFSGAGLFNGVQWSPDGQWLLVAWRDADQWLFIRSTNVQTIRAVSHIRSQFNSTVFPWVAGWCCAH